ncbi:hypothetical protein N7489_000579 [Penicillium chrysogenum]|uniref:Uncharacterized protein n=1 Tax=Penicillium chrysogenum TaxID=5076 RepID=A0ABQ8WG76_PENCH|nr:uncharacterized protein N7489_000579 [Penicillium chrysogenum]KAJ5250169.1 hypothetical protein N7489_000579 [Penicillium chrysogenum]KAJ5269075.1 hypothetical protein N7505_004833 [Penicillium chrysogenum]KAJ6148213.1 hypothetical protein N7497_010195 [Penicillium chrysogenum]
MHCFGTPDSQGYQDYKAKQEQIKSTSENHSNQDNKRHTLPSKTKTVSQADAELRERLEQMSGEGGASGIEYEDGKPNAMKRGNKHLAHLKCHGYISKRGLVPSDSGLASYAKTRGKGMFSVIGPRSYRHPSEPDFLSFVSDSIDEDARDAQVLLRVILPN